MFNQMKNSLHQDRDSLLRDGTPCRIRPIGADDRHLIRACFARLSPESRRLRFFGAKPALSENDLAFLTGADGFDHLALGAIELNARGDEVALLGVARCIRLGTDPDTGELALAVADQAQGQGIGRRLLAALVDDARAQGMRRFRCEVLAANTGMRALIAGPDTHVRWLEDGTLEYDYPFPEQERPPQASWPSVFDPLAWARTGAGVLERILDETVVAGATLLRFWVDQWSSAGSTLPDVIVSEQRPIAAR